MLDNLNTEPEKQKPVTLLEAAIVKVADDIERLQKRRDELKERINIAMRELDDCNLALEALEPAHEKMMSGIQITMDL